MMNRLFILLTALTVMATPAMALITNSAHDLSSTSTYYTTNNGETDEICVFCHTPHKAQALAFAPLWNRGASTFNVQVAYGNPTGTMDGTASAATANLTDAPLCLSCHDGSNMVIALTNPPNGVAMNDPEPANSDGAGVPSAVVTGDADLIELVATTELNNDHPIGMDYADAVTGGEMVAIGSVTVPLFGAGNDIVWCSSCHDVHNAVVGTDALLQIDNAGSLLCLNCHAK